MSSGVLDAALPAPRTRWGTITLLSLAGLVGVVFFSMAALPYYLSSTYGPPVYASKRGWLLLHIAGGAVALLTGPVQLWLGLSDRGIAWHRRIGVAYLASVAVGSLGAFYLATHTDFGLVFGAGLFGLAVAWVCTTGLAFLAIKRTLIDQHKEWMIRSYVVTFAFVFFRMIFPVLQTAQIGALNEQLALAAWACWALPLLVTELVLQGRKIVVVRS
ncbi:MAG TPA: DUF2306 domain-containing protein [Vicinamibacterales bacterium]